MAIEIKELSVHVKIVEDDKPILSQKNFGKDELQVLTDNIIKECTSKVLEYLKEKNER